MIKTLDIKDFQPNAKHTIWDVRDNQSYRNGHIEHAQNHPLDTLNLSLLEQTTDEIYILCGGGTKAQKACELLQSLNPDGTYIHLIGGTRGAIAQGMTIIQEI